MRTRGLPFLATAALLLAIAPGTGFRASLKAAGEQLPSADELLAIDFPPPGSPTAPGGLVPVQAFSTDLSTRLIISQGGTIGFMDDRGQTSLPLRPYTSYTGPLHVAGSHVNDNGNDRIVLFAAPSGPSTFPISVFLNGPPYEPLGEFGVIPGGAQFGTRIELGNLFGDDAIEIIVGTGPGGPGELHVMSPGRDDVISIHPGGPAYTGPLNFFPGDFTGDGFDDLFIGLDGGRAQIWTCRNGRLVPIGQGRPLGPQYTGPVIGAAFDFNNDGSDELVVGSGNSQQPVRLFNVRNSMTTPVLLKELAVPGNPTGVFSLDASVIGGRPAIAISPNPDDSPTTREQMSIFLLMEHGSDFREHYRGAPSFSDVPPSNAFCRFIEELARRGVIPQ